MLSLGTPNGQLVNYHGILDGAKFAYQSIIDSLEDNPRWSQTIPENSSPLLRTALETYDEALINNGLRTKVELQSIDKATLVNALLLFCKRVDDPSEVLFIVKGGKIYFERFFIQKDFSESLRRIYSAMDELLVCPIIFVHLKTRETHKLVDNNNIVVAESKSRRKQHILKFHATIPCLDPSVEAQWKLDDLDLMVTRGLRAGHRTSSHKISSGFGKYSREELFSMFLL